MLKKRRVNVILFSLIVIGSLLFSEYLLEWKGVRKYQTWLEMNAKGFMENRASFEASAYTFEQPTIYTLDKYGFRKTDVLNPSDSSRKILILGDSYIFGLYLKDEETITHQLNHTTNSSIQFYNGGVGGAGTGDQLWNFRKYARSIKFDEVIIMMNYDDVDRIVFKNLFVIRNEELIESQRFKPTKWYYLIHHSSWHSFLEKHSRLYFLRSKLFWKNLFFYDDYKFYPEKTQYVWPKTESLYVTSDYSTTLFVELVRLFKKECEDTHVQFKIATTGYPPDSLQNPHTYKIFQKLDSITTELAIPFLDLRQMMQEKSGGDLSKLQLKQDPHPNREANKHLSDELINVWYPSFKKD